MRATENTTMTDPNEIAAQAIQETIATVGADVWKAKLALFVIKPLTHLMAMAYCAVLLYAGTWIVVLALKHSGAIR